MFRASNSSAHIDGRPGGQQHFRTGNEAPKGAGTSQHGSEANASVFSCGRHRRAGAEPVER